MPAIIAEFCQNHRGDRGLLQEMVWAAAEMGADYAKIQTIWADDLTFRPRFEKRDLAPEKRDTIERPYQAEHDRLESLEVDEDGHPWFIEECGRAGIRPMTTVFTRATVPFVASLSWDAVKVASYDCSSYPLLRELRPRFAHMFVSTGATLDHEIEAAAQILKAGSYSFLHCVTIYPTPLEEMHLARMKYLQMFTPSVGLSDHSLVARDGLKASIVALSLGADVIERHFTLLSPEETKDGPVSITPDGLRELVSFARLSRDDLEKYVAQEIPEADAMVGQERRPLSATEKLNRDYYRGRFASRAADDQVVYNWDEQSVS